MIVDRDIKPEKNIYFVGSEVLKVIQTEQFGVVSIGEVFYQLQKEFLPNINFNYFMLALDWLFILELIETNEEGDLVRCF